MNLTKVSLMMDYINTYNFISIFSMLLYELCNLNSMCNEEIRRSRSSKIPANDVIHALNESTHI